MKKVIFAALLCLFLTLFFVSCAEPTTTEPETTWEFSPYPVTTAISPKIQQVTDWAKSYLQNHSATLSLVAEEVLKLENPHWVIQNSADGFSPNGRVVPDEDWMALSTLAQQTIEAVDSDWRNEFGQDIRLGIDCGGITRNDGRRALNFSLQKFNLLVLLSYFPDGYAGIREDTPYVDFGDGWYFYCDDTEYICD